MPKPLWKKGQSGNPSGRKKMPDVSKEWFETHTQFALERLEYWAKSTNAKASMQAAQLILAYSLGKPVENHEVSGHITLEQILGEVNP